MKQHSKIDFNSLIQAAENPIKRVIRKQILEIRPQQVALQYPKNIYYLQSNNIACFIDCDRV